MMPMEVQPGMLFKTWTEMAIPGGVQCPTYAYVVGTDDDVVKCRMFADYATPDLRQFKCWGTSDVPRARVALWPLVVTGHA